MLPRFAAATIAVALAVGLAACQPEPEPSPTGPVFASEEEAFAAAEQTYRAYVDALNQVDLSDPETFEAVYAWTTGEFRADEKKTFSTMHADGWVVSGESVITRIDFLAAATSRGQVSIGACVDVSSVTLVDAAGASQVSADRPDAQSTAVQLVASSSSSTGLLIAEVEGAELDPPCRL